MSAVKMPGFTASASLYSTVGSYCAFSVVSAPSNAVGPQMTKAGMDEWMKGFLAGPGTVVPPWQQGVGGGFDSIPDGGSGDPSSSCPSEPKLKQLYCQIERRECRFGDAESCDNVKRCC